MNHKRYKPAKRRAAARCQCNPHQKARGNQRTSPEQLREALRVKDGA